MNFSAKKLSFRFSEFFPNVIPIVMQKGGAPRQNSFKKSETSDSDISVVLGALCQI